MHVEETAAQLPEPFYSEQGDVRHLHFGKTTRIAQGSMRLDDPDALYHEYARQMMAWLLFVDPDTVSQRHAMQLGLGAASLTKFCLRRLGMKTTAIELNQRVVAACLLWFELPAQHPHLAVALGDARKAVTLLTWQGRVDALQVDLADEVCATPVHDNEPFWSDARQLLTPDGCMTVNVFGSACDPAASAKRVQAAFGAGHVWAFECTAAANTVLVVPRGSAPSRAQMFQRAKAIESRWGLEATSWVYRIKRVG
jgi:spermidine synthase